MILVFGGTTEGRKAVEVLEEAGNLYYYSTRSDGQEVELVNGQRLMGAMDVPEMMAFCKEHDIRLMIDAAHPFAEELHRNLLFVARHIGVPVIRYDRIYPPHDPDIVWCKDYQDAMKKLEAEGINRLLALTGVNNIGTLRPYWERHECWVRILNRRVSQMLARKAGFPEDHLVYYEEVDSSQFTVHSSQFRFRQLLEQLKPQAILTKESGLSGGFTEKVEAAKAAGVKVFVIERPEYPSVHSSSMRDCGSAAVYGTTFFDGTAAMPQYTGQRSQFTVSFVNGPHGLRRVVEKLLPEFFPLKSGLTTGTCATAAAIAATLLLVHHERPSAVPVVLPNGETIHVPVGYGESSQFFDGTAAMPQYTEQRYAYCIKEAGDDPDVTNGVEIRAKAEWAEEFEIVGGEGVGRFTLPGFDFPPGEAAINKGPRQMIRENVLQFIGHSSSTGLRQCRSIQNTVRITISVPRGEEIARRTFNPRLGIEGGISIIGVSGIVKPFSEEAFIDSIRKCMTVAFASGTDRVVINSGAKSERFLRARYPELPGQAFVQYGNYIGETLKMAAELGIRNVTLGVMLGKAVKLAQGHLDTHSRKATMDLDFIRELLREAGSDVDISGITLARELWDKFFDGTAAMPQYTVQRFVDVVIRHCAAHCCPLLPDGQLTILLIDDDGNVYSS